MSHLDKLFFGLSYYLIWLVAILSAAQGYVWLGFIFSLIICLGLLARLAHYELVSSYLPAILVVLWVGYGIDCLWQYLGVLVFKSTFPYSAPAWILGIWMNFSFVYIVLLSTWLRQYLLMGLAATFGFPLVYYAGVRLGAAEFNLGWLSMVIIGLFWGLFLPGLNWFLIHKMGVSDAHHTA